MKLRSKLNVECVCVFVLNLIQKISVFKILLEASIA